MSFQLYLAFLVMTFLRPIELLAPDLAVYRPMLILSILLFIVSVVSASSSKKMAATKQHFSILIWFFIVVGVSVTMHEGVGRGIATMVEFGPTPMLFVTSVLNLTSIERLRKAGRVLVICIVIQALMGINAYYTGFMVDLLFYREGLSAPLDGSAMPGGGANPMGGIASDIPAFDQSGGHLWRMRSFGFLSDPNDFAQMLVATLPLLVVFYRQRAFFRNLFAVGIPAAAMVFSIYLTHSRGALLGLASLTFFGVKRKLGTVTTSLLVVVAMMGAMAADFTGGRAYTANEESAGGRVDAWSEGMVMLRSSPIWGVGYNRFQEHHTHTAHNSFVLCFAELGVWGYFLWLGMIVLVFKQLNMSIEATPASAEEHRWALALRTAMVGFFTCAMFLSRAYHPPLYILMSLGIGAWYCTKQIVTGPAAVPFAQPVKWKGTAAWITVLSIIFFWAIVVVKTATTGKSV